MNGRLKLILMASLQGVAPASIACERPNEMAVPDGATATEEQMIAADAEYRRFMDGMRAYQDCLDRESTQNRPANGDAGVLGQYENALVARHNAASEAMTRVTDAFNTAIEKYKSRQ